MKNFSAISLILLGGQATAQIEGDTIVCAGNIYTYTANIPAATSYDWSFPSGWYEVSGLGSTSVTITCNTGAGDVCVTGYDDLNQPIGPFCIPTEFGGGGSGFDLQPANVSACEPFGFATEVTFSMIPNGTGGGCAPCGGTPHPNITNALYNNSFFPNAQFVSFLAGGPIFIQPPGGSYTVFLVDHTNGTDNANAVVISGGCGGSGNATASVTVNPIQYPIFSQSPPEACIGETVTVYVTNSNGGSWSNAIDMDVLDPFNPLVAIVTGPNATAQYSGLDFVGCPLEAAGHAITYCVMTSIATAQPEPLLQRLGDHAYAVNGSAVSVVKVLSLRGDQLLRANARLVDLGSFASGIYLLQADMADGTVMRWKVVR
ncbi:MAG: hypothetical protein ABI599_00465 [Flavobacteriales bacterium]